TLDEMINPVTGSSYSMFEPALDYVVCKMPRFPFDKFEHADRHLGTQMKATGEVMAIGRNIEESLLKACRSLEIGVIHNEISDFADLDMDTLAERIKHPQDDRFFYLSEAVRRGVDIDLLNQWTGINPFFLDKLLVIAELEEELSQNVGDQYSLRKAKVKGFSDVKIAELWDWTPEEVRKYRLETGILPSYKMVDTCAGEFESQTPYFYSTYAEANESQVSDREKVIVLGSGPIRIGQGVEFDYATVHCVEALKHAGYEAIVINSNPETVSTDFSISDKLYFEPLSFEDVMNVIDLERPKGVIVQFGGQTAINLAWPLARAGVKLLGTQVEDIDRAEDRDLFEQLIHSLNIPQPNGKTVMNESEAVKAAKEIGYPVLVRPSYVIGGRAMEIVYSETELHKYIQSAVEVSEDHPVLIDDYLLGIECEVDVISDGEDAYVPGIMEHIERAGVHSGDSIAAYPPQNLSASVQATIIKYSQELAKSLHCVGLMNIQFIVQGEKVYVIEVNPRASRTVPFLSKVTNISMAQVATQLILGKKLGDLIDLSSPKEADGVYIKAPVFSFNKLAKVDSLLGPEMKSTGEVIGCGRSLEEALYKAFEASGLHLPQFGNILFTIDDLSKEEALTLANGFKCLGYEILTTTGTGQYFSNNGLKVKAVAKISSNEANSIPNLIENGKIQAIINTVGGQKEAGEDGQIIRQLAIEHNIPLFTTLDTALAMLKVLQSRSISTQAL
ncbi:carbamoyl-phosphate synthase large subunit, partial [Aerococcus urinae]